MTKAGAHPFSQFGIAELEKIVAGNLTDRATLEAVLRELGFRHTQRAARLRLLLEKALRTACPSSREAEAVIDRAAEADSGSQAKPPPELPFSAHQHRRAEAQPRQVEAAPVVPAPLPGRAQENRMEDILRAWTVLEVLSPATFRRPADLAAGDNRRIARLDRGLPWDDGPAKGPMGTRLYFQIVLGTVAMKPAMDQLLTRFADKRPEKPQARGEAPLAIVVVDRFGKPVQDACATVSSFAWGLPRALRDEPSTLAAWTAQEERLQGELHSRLYREDETGGVRPLTLAALNAAFEWLVDECGLDRGSVTRPSFAVRSLVSSKSSELPEPILLNSFYLKDLARAGELVRRGQCPETLQRFLGAKSPAGRRDLLSDMDAVESALAPARFPLARWPGAGRHPLVLMQQAAVNLASEQRAGEILAVNGPPGTGKTTLLRDVVAALVSQRADAMARFDDPETAFTASGQKQRFGSAFVHLYRLDPSLKGFEMLIASSNNKAVENVSAELPAIGAVAEDAASLRYFEPLADELLGTKAWGAIAAVLGNAANRTAFRDRFWWNKETGLFGYLKTVCGTPAEIDLPGGTTRPPKIVADLQPPQDRREALRRWHAARARYTELRGRVEAQHKAAETLRLASVHLPRLERAFEACREHAAMRPGLLARLFGSAAWRQWRAEHLDLSATLAKSGRPLAKSGALPLSEAVLAASPWLRFRPAKGVEATSGALRPALAALRGRQAMRGVPVLDDAFFDGPRDTVQTAAPWLTPAEHRDRDALFEAALDLHRAFVDAAAKPLRQNLGMAMQVLDGKGLDAPEKDSLIPDLWSSLFLVVPAVSTTFASVGNMLKMVPPEGLGWLLVDEAGQASPQQAVGALMRVKRAIVVGDPVQVEPVVLLPESLTGAICRSFGIDPDRFSAPAGSVQTLADGATSSFAEFPARSGTRTVGVPLLVHRRCADPMFKVANRVAYEGLMVQAKAASISPIRDLLGPARWIDVRGSGEDKWCEAEGQVVVGLLEEIARAGLEFDLYIVTPFVIVADGVRRMIAESPVLAEAIPDLAAWARSRVGTVHTVQGREAEAVLFVLGAPDAAQSGARNWAGKTPNLLNVAMTRAKEVAYVIGNRKLWKRAGVFADLDGLAGWRAGIV
jgi:hypothetical protein